MDCSQRAHLERRLAELKNSLNEFQTFEQNVRNFAEAYRDALRIIDLPRVRELRSTYSLGDIH